MPPDQNTTQNQDSEQNSTPPSPQEPTEPASLNTAYSEPSEALPEALEGSGGGFTSESNNVPVSNSTPDEQKQPENISSAVEAELTHPISETAKNQEASESVTPQMGRNEPLGEPVSVESSIEALRIPKPQTQNPVLVILAKASLAIQFRKRKKLNRILDLFAKQTSITNDEVEKYLHVSDATATRYLSILEKEGKIKKNEAKGKTGKWVSYLKI